MSLVFKSTRIQRLRPRCGFCCPLSCVSFHQFQLQTTCSSLLLVRQFCATANETTEEFEAGIDEDTDSSQMAATSAQSMVDTATRSLTEFMSDSSVLEEYESVKRRKKVFSYPISSTQLSRNIEKLPMTSKGPVIVPSNDDAYAPKLSLTQMQWLESGRSDVPIHDGNGTLVLADGSPLLPMSRNGELPALRNRNADSSQMGQLTDSSDISSTVVDDSDSDNCNTLMDSESSSALTLTGGNALVDRDTVEMEGRIFQWIEATEHLYRNVYKQVLECDPQCLDLDASQNGDNELLKLPPEAHLFWAQTGLSQADIRNWNLLLAVTGHHSHSNPKHSALTIDGNYKRKELLLTAMQSMADISAANLQNDDPMLDVKVEALPQSQQTLANILSGGKQLSAEKEKMDCLPTLRQFSELRPNLETYEIMMKTLAKHGKHELVIDLMRECGNDGYNPSQACYRWLLYALTKKGLSKDAYSTLKYLKANSPHLDNRIDLDCYKEVIKGFIGSGQPKLAKLVFDDMMQLDGEHPNTDVYNEFIGYYRLTRNVNGAIDLVREMESRGYLATQKTYEKLLFACAYGDSEDAALLRMFEVFDEMIVSKELPPTTAHFSALIAGCGRIGDIESATRVLHLMDSMAIERDTKVYLYYLRCIADTAKTRISGRIDIGASRRLRLNHLIQLGEAIVYNMQRSEALTVDSGIVNALLSIYTLSGAAKRSMLFWKSMATRFPNVAMNERTFHLLWDCVAVRAKRYTEARHLFEWFCSNRIVGRRSMQLEVLRPTERMYRTMVRLAAKFKDVEGCKQYLVAMKSAGLTVTERDRAFLATVIGSAAEQLEARRRLSTEIERSRVDTEIRKKAGKPNLRMAHWSPKQKRTVRKAAGVILNQEKRTTGRIFWNVNKTLGQLDDPW